MVRSRLQKSLLILYPPGSPRVTEHERMDHEERRPLKILPMPADYAPSSKGITHAFPEALALVNSIST